MLNYEGITRRRGMRILYCRICIDATPATQNTHKKYLKYEYMQ